MITSHQLYTTACAILLALVVVGCDLKTEAPPTGTITSSDNFLHGSVRLVWDAYGNTVSSFEGVEVVAVSSSGTYKDTTDVAGDWVLYDLPAGVYEITCTLDGYNGLTGGGHSRLTNIQYVGVDDYEVQEMRLARDIAPDMISDASVQVTWSYLGDVRPDTTIIIDSTAEISVSLRTQNVDGWSYIVYVVTDPDDDCSHAIATTGTAKIPSTGAVTFNVNALYPDIRKALGAAMSSTPLYLHIRPWFMKRPDSASSPVTQCITPLVLPLDL